MAAPQVPNWQVQILHGIGAPVTQQNLTFLNAWTRAEGGGASNNPFNTTQHAQGAKSYNTAGVREYLSPQQGIQATVQTLNNGRYGNILAALRQGTNARAAASALAASPWGTGALVEKILGGGGPIPAAAIQGTAPAPVRGLQSALPAPPPKPIIDPQILSLFNQGNEMFGLSPLPASLGIAPPSSAPSRQPMTAGPPTPSRVAAPPYLPTKPAGGKPLVIKGSSVPYIEHFAAPFGLTITSTTGGRHAEHSYHSLGRAVDFGGNPRGMAELAAYALKHPNQFTEMFYTGPGHPGYFISQGKVLPLSQLDRNLYQEHENHVHLAR